MGNKQSTVENSCIQEFSKINEEELDISRIDKLQIKALKEINNDKIMYKLPAINLCSYSLI